MARASTLLLSARNVVDEFSRNPGTGALTFIGCVGQLAGCSPTSPSDAVSAPIAVAVSADGSSVYASSNGGAVDEFQRNTTTGALTFQGCIGAEVAGCTVPSKPNSMHALGDVVISPDGTSVYAGGETGSIATFTRNTSTGALTFTECIGYLPECNRPSVYFAVNEPLSLAISPDGANLYAGNFNNDLVDVFSREAGTGKLTFTGCNGHFAEEPAACSEPPKGVPEGPLQIAISPDGADLYVASDSSVSEFARGSSGALTFAGCIGQVLGVCGETNPAEAVVFQVSLALSPNGANLYSGNELSHVIDEFGRVTPPAVGPPAVGPPAGSTVSTHTSTSTGGGGQPSTAGIASTTGIATTPQAVEEVLLACTKRPLVLNDVLIRGNRVLLQGSAAKSLHGKKVKIIFDGHEQVATATIAADGEFSTTAWLPPVRLRNGNSARYQAESGSQRSLDLKLTRRLTLEPPRFSAGTVTLVGQVLPPLSKPIALVTVQQQLECGATTTVGSFKPSASGHFHITLKVPAIAKAGLYRLISSVTEKPGSKHGFTTYSLPLPVILG
jgi:DNA-binding beta-propeller fold protein YncE